jgi:ATP-dependent DNA helicase RecG
MPRESTRYDKKSLRLVDGLRTNFQELALDCVAFATAHGGVIDLGIEDDDDSPPATQRVHPDLPQKIRRRIGELTVNVDVRPDIVTAPNGGQYVALNIPRSAPLPSTSDGRYAIRTTDGRVPVLGDDVLRLANERATFPWETQTSLEIPRQQAEGAKVSALVQRIRASDRVKDSLKEKTDSEILDHYALARGRHLTNLGILCVGTQADRNRLGTAPVIQVIKYDEQQQKVNKFVWDDYALSPIELVEAVWEAVPDFKETYEIPDGLLRSNVPAYDELVVRELLVNALVHRPYTQRGDIFLNLHPDRLQIVNPGRLPIGVSPQNILHTTVRRNDNLARVFHDLKLMEREGSGFDRMYEVLLSQGRPVPELREGPDRVEVVVRRRIISARAIDIIAKVDAAFQLRQRETICLGLLAQYEALTARELAEKLELPDIETLHAWLGRLTEFGLVHTSGRTKSTRYFVAAQLVRDLELPTSTTLQRIEPHRLRALILEDLRHFPGSAISQINDRIGTEINTKRLKRALDDLVEQKLVRAEGERRGRTYWPELR